MHEQGMDPEEVGAGTGAAARDPGEEGEPVSLDAFPSADDMTDDRWEALGREEGAMTEEGAGGGFLRDEGAPREGGEPE